MPHLLGTGYEGWYFETIDAGSAHGFLLSGLRWANDVSSFLFVAGVAYFISAKARSIRGAVFWSYVVAPAALLTLLSPDFWWTFLVFLSDGGVRGYWFLVLALIVVRALVAFRLVARVGRNFDSYALDEPVEPERPSPRRSRVRR